MLAATAMPTAMRTRPPRSSPRSPVLVPIRLPSSSPIKGQRDADGADRYVFTTGWGSLIYPDILSLLSTPCLQSDVSARCGGADLARQLSVSSREIPLLTLVNGTLMAR